jgi:hypothetical protein
MNPLPLSAVLVTGILFHLEWRSSESTPGFDALHPSRPEVSEPLPAPAAAQRPGGGLVITCPETAKLFCGDSTDPSVTGFPTVSGACDDHPVITYQDNITTTGCPADRFDTVILRTWTAHDSCRNWASCVQKIDVIKNIVYLDMHPQSCPNPVKVSGNGVIPAAILGTANFDVTQIDPTSIQLWGEHCDGGPVSPVQYNYEDVSTPYTGSTDCGCNTLHGDGYLDLTLKFDKHQVVSSLDLASYPHFSFVRVFVIGKLVNGCSFISKDCVRVQ